MSLKLPDGSTLAIESTLGADLTVSALTNANPAVATSTGHGLATGDVIKLESGWNRLNDRVFKVTVIDVNTFSLDGVDTTSTTRYPAGGGTGTANEVTAWTQITQVLEFSTAGGEQQFVTVSLLEEDFERQLPTVKSAMSLTLSIGDDATLPWYSVMSTANEDRVPRALRLTLPDNAIIYYNGIVTLNPSPTTTKGQVMALASTVSLSGLPTRYAS
jgi:hypothetical protein